MAYMRRSTPFVKGICCTAPISAEILNSVSDASQLTFRKRPNLIIYSDLLAVGATFWSLTLSAGVSRLTKWGSECLEGRAPSQACSLERHCLQWPYAGLLRPRWRLPSRILTMAITVDAAGCLLAQLILEKTLR
jgi:hypothetical protein